MDNSDKHLVAKIGQYVIVENDNKILLLQRKRSKNWSLPGGRLNKDDKDWNGALKREVKEETGLNVSHIRPFDVKLIEDTYQTKYCTFFTASSNNISDLNISEEHVQSRWVK